MATILLKIKTLEIGVKEQRDTVFLLQITVVPLM